MSSRPTKTIHCNSCRANFGEIKSNTRYVQRGAVVPRHQVSNLKLGANEVSCYYCDEAVGYLYEPDSVLLHREKVTVLINIHIGPTIFEASCTGAASEDWRPQTIQKFHDIGTSKNLDQSNVNQLVEIAYVYRIRAGATEIVITIKLRRRVNWGSASDVNRREIIRIRNFGKSINSLFTNYGVSNLSIQWSVKSEKWKWVTEEISLRRVRVREIRN